MNDFIRPTDRKIVTLVGMMGAGKTTTGFGLAQRLNIKFIDSDREIEKIENQSITKIFNDRGEEYLKSCEKEVIHKLSNFNKPHVLSIGGRSFEDDSVRKIIKEKTISLFLEVELEVLLERVKRRNTRPFLELGNKEDIMQKIYSEQLELYKQADVIVNTTYLRRETAIDVIVKSLGEYIAKNNSSQDS